MIPPGHPTGRIHPLLYHRPIPFRRHDERMKIELKTILHGRIVHFRGKSAAPYQRLPVQTGTFGYVQQFSGMSACPLLPISAKIGIRPVLCAVWT